MSSKKTKNTAITYLTKQSKYDKLRDEQLPEYYKTLETNPLYSLEVDPLNQYHMSDEQKNFIICYVEYKRLPTAASFAGISNDDAKKYMLKYGTKQEIRRLNSAMSQRQFATQMLNLQQLGGYLTALLEGSDVYEANQLDSNQKLKAANLLIRINEILEESMNSPSIMINDALTKELENLNIDQLESLLDESNINEKIIEDENEKSTLIQQLNYDNHLMPEEIAYLKTLEIKELQNLLDNQETIIIKPKRTRKKAEERRDEDNENK